VGPQYATSSCYLSGADDFDVDPGFLEDLCSCGPNLIYANLVNTGASGTRPVC
jgi:hypothetical protein